nr:hypothetical protein [Tanacetum cinerariifolium]
MSKNDMKGRICTLSKNDLKDLVRTYRIPLDLHPHLPDPGFTMDRLLADAIGIYSEFLWFLTFVSLFPHSCLVKKSKGPSQASRPSKKRKLQKRASEAGSSAPELDQADGVDKADLADLCAKIKDSLERDEGVFMRVVLAPTPCLGKRLGAPPSIVVTSVSDPSHVGTLAPASTSGRSLSLRDFQVLLMVVVLGSSGLRWIPDDDFGTATCGEEIDLTLFPLAHGPYHMPYPYEGVSSPLYTKEEWNERHALESNIMCKDIFKDQDVCRKPLDRTITPAELSYELNSRNANLVSSKAHLQEMFDKKKWDVKLLCSEVTSLDNNLENLKKGYDNLGQENRELRSQRDVASEEVRKLQSQLTDAKPTSKSLSEELTQTDAKLSEQALTVRDLQNELVLEKSKSREYKDAMDGLRDEADFDKALDDFPTTLFPFLSKIVVASEGGLPDVAQILPEKFSHSATSVDVTSSYASEAPKQVFKFIRSASLFSSSDIRIVLLMGMPIFAASSGRIPCSIYSWIGVIQVLVASSSIALTSVEYSSPSGSIKIRPTPDPCSLKDPLVYSFHKSASVPKFSDALASEASYSSTLFPSARVSFGPLAFICVGLSPAIVSAKKSTSTYPFIALLGAYLMP